MGIVMGTVVESRAARWVTAGATAASTAEGEPAPSATAALAARARLVAGSAALQARVAERHHLEAQARFTSGAAVGAAAAVASLCCALVALGPAFAPGLLSPQTTPFAAAAAALLGLVPAGLLGAAAIGRAGPSHEARAAMATSESLASVGSAFGRAIGTLDVAAQADVAHAIGALIGALEAEVGTVERSRPPATPVPARRHQRIVPIERRVVVRTGDGRNLIGTVADVSLSGVALTANLPRVAVGDAVAVGSRRAVVARVWERGIAFQFERELDPETFDAAIVL